MVNVLVGSLVLATAVISIATESSVAQTKGRWIGAVQYQHAFWSLRAEIDPNADDAVLSFPDLGLAGLSAPMVRHEDGVEIEFPFGLGRHRLILTDEVMRSNAEPDPEMIYIELQADEISAPIEEVVRFRSGGVELVGTLYQPEDAEEGRTGLVVCGHGAEPFHRGTPEHRFWSEFLTRRGFAVFLYDKRGTGESGGTHDGATLEELARDLSNAAEIAMERSATPPERTALLGGSQFGWLAFRAARDQNIRVIALSAAPTVDPITLETRVLYEVYTAKGIEGDDLADAMAYTRAYFSSARHPEYIPHVQALASSHASSPWIDMAPVPSGPDDLAWWANNGSYDPASDIRRFDGFVYAAYGDQDLFAPPDLNALRLEQLGRINGGEVTIWIAKGADHRLEVPSGVFDNAFRFPQLAPGFLSQIESFLRQHLVIDQDSLRTP